MNLPGTIYLNRYRYWWVVRLPGSSGTEHIPLKPPGARQATRDRKTAELVATEIWQKALRKHSSSSFDGRLATLVQLFHNHNLAYYPSSSKSTADIGYAIFPLASYFPDMMADEYAEIDQSLASDAARKLG
ncbi:MAG: hypothetical protein JW810_10255 [Sedimentisphaerales bacterium]|nr:hypothetical protein [Sedimentisphaerales bacterium]